jgi:MFS family permease
LGGVLADRQGTRSKSMYAIIPAIAFLGTLPFYVAGVLSSSIEACMLISLVPTALGLVWLGPVLTAVQHLVPSDMRSTASAIFLFINNLIGIGLGTTLIGILSDALRVRGAGAESLRYAILSGTGFYMVAALLFFFAARHLKKDWVGET